MLQTLSKSFESNPEFIDTTTSLLQETFQTLVIAVSGILGLWYVAVGLLQPDLLGDRFWVVFFTTLALLRLVLYLKDRSFLAAVVCWLVGLAGLNLLAVFMFDRPEQLFFFALLPLLAVILGGWTGGVLAEALVIILIVWLGRGAFAPYLAPFGILIPVLGAVTGLLGWVASRTMVALSGWSYYNFNLAREKMEDARVHRGQVYKMLKDLDLAYYRLERANAALVAAWREAENAERSKSEFVTYVSHEMRTPLNLIAGFSEMILTAPESYGGVPLPGPYREDLNKINQNAGHLLELVDDIVDLSRINVGKITLAREPVDLAGLVIETANMVGDYIKLKGLELHLNLPADLPLVPVDRLRVRQVLLNLLVNAARFTESGSISIELHPVEEALMVRVSDTGRGIAEVDLPRVFEQYNTTEAPSSTWHSGAGLGLPISKKLVELHRGRMGVESIFQKGTTFWFTLPLETEDIARSSVRAFTALPYTPKSAGRIVVVAHEDARVQLTLQRHLEDTLVLWAADQQSAEVLVQENQAVALIVDDQAPPQESQSGCLVVRCPLPSSRRTARTMGAADLLYKPIDAADLLAAIDRLPQPVSTVLAVDDEPEMVQLLQRMLVTRYLSENCLAAYSGAQALEVMRAHQPDVVLLDITMPDVDGRQVLAQMAQDPALAGIQVIVISGMTQENSAAQIGRGVSFNRHAGFQFGDVMGLLGAAFNALAPGWQVSNSTGAAPAAAPPASPA